MVWNKSEYKDVGINTLLARASRDLVNYAEKKVNSTGGRTTDIYHELRDYIMDGNPRMRYLNLPERKNNLSAQIAEMMMVLAGNPELHQLSRFLPRAINYSDDGKVWRGNYGTRIRGINAYPSPLNDISIFPAILWEDQLNKVINTLKANPTSRQVTITIHDSKIDTGMIKTKDTPCTMDLVFGVSEGKLNLSVHMRSNDVVFGFTGVNYFIFTMIQEMVASMVGLECGKYCHNAVSFHVYDDYYKTVEKLSEYADEDTKSSEVMLDPLFVNTHRESRDFGSSMTLDQFDKMAIEFFDILNMADNSELSKEDVQSSMISYVADWGNYGIGKLTLIPMFYVHSLPISELLTWINDDKVRTLIDRDTFLPKHCPYSN